MKKYDLIIVGAGIAGTVLALDLASRSQQIKIALIEKNSFQMHNLGGLDARAIALSHGSIGYFKQIKFRDNQNLWNKIKGLACPILDINISDSANLAHLNLNATEFNLARLGAVIELDAVGKILIDELNKFTNIDLYCPAEISQISLKSVAVSVDLTDQKQQIHNLEANLIVGADGVDSAIAKISAIEKRIISEYNQSAVIATVIAEKPHKNQAFEFFRSEGPLALLPLNDDNFTGENHKLSLVWCSKNPDRLTSLSNSEFLAELQQAFGDRLGEFIKVGRIFSYPLTLSTKERHIGHRVALIGNAAQCLHPIAGQGFNLGLRDIAFLSQNILYNLQQNIDIGTLEALDRYEKSRRIDQKNMTQITDRLVKIFSNDNKFLSIGRNLGLKVLGLNHQMKLNFIKPMLGWRGYEKL